ncbi:carboxypeptidase family protein [Luteibacter rhizovicinus]|uniref:Carboxypeptidase family protein n=1 Tax=Luteibacter rhizovicinus TaxID=242606 RepID=A0A4R3YI58_9GAMM|nr:TonB-dependent receptor [Luteibacter rhizovicinus]TCV92325.1 carboxypeptidase family protein [Luteibacter rhizovicinus]
MQVATRLTRPAPRRLALAVAIACCIAGSGTALAQSNSTGVIYGSAAPGDTVHIENAGTGFKRDITTDSSGRYRAASLPIGTYNVTLIRNGTTLESHNGVQTSISQGTDVSFSAGTAGSGATTLGTVEVSGTTLPSIDVSSVDSRTVLNADQLQKLPIARTSISSIALLAPGTTQAARGYGNALSFGGSSASENSYYINGFQATNPLTGVSSRQLPYDAIDQEQVLIGGYGAEYGRSTGGVINVVSKRGTNDFKGDIQVLWAPSTLAQQPRNVYLTNGTLYQKGNAFALRNNETLQYSGSFGGPLIKDKLFFFIAADWYKQTGDFTGSRAVSDDEQQTAKTKRWLGKIDWNITDNHILEFTGFGDNEQTDSTIYGYNYTTGRGKFLGTQYTKNYNLTQTNATPGGTTYIAHYTGYITDDFTINAMYGRSDADHQQTVNGASGTPCPSITDSRVEFSSNRQTGCTVGGTTTLLPGSSDSSRGWNINLEYRLGDHDLRAGMDNYVLRAKWGAIPVGGTAYIYNDVGNGSSIKQRLINLGLDPASYNPANFPNGYYVESTALTTGTSARTNQRSEFIEDNWQITDRWHGYIGLRNEQFTNYNGVGEVYAKARHQLDPRLGVSWDVYGDSSLKIYANAGRYHLGLPTSVAVRGAGPSTYPSNYYSFTSIDPATGIPQGLSTGAPYSGTYYLNGANGTPPDAKTVSAQQLHSYYQDEYILGFDKQLPDNWVVGAKAMYRKLRSLIDDTCDPAPLQAWGDRNGLSAEVAAGINRSTGCWLFNPGRANTFTLSPADGQYISVPLTAKDIGEPTPKRRYYMLDLYAEHQFSDKWYGKIDYTFSRSYGNSEGQLDSNIVQADVSTTESWDFPAIMENTNGPLPNDQKHQLRVFGSYAPTDEWQFSTVTRIASGVPISCLGIRPLSAGGDPYGYGANYFWCNGNPAPRGSRGRTPWTYNLDVSAAWKPAYLDHKLALTIDVFNLLGKQRVTQYFETGETSQGLPSPNYMRARSFQDPRYVRLGARYDFTL